MRVWSVTISRPVFRSPCRWKETRFNTVTVVFGGFVPTVCDVYLPGPGKTASPAVVPGVVVTSVFALADGTRAWQTTTTTTSSTAVGRPSSRVMMIVLFAVNRNANRTADCDTIILSSYTSFSSRRYLDRIVWYLTSFSSRSTVNL